MENTLLIGLSRQTVLERQLDVVANNIANVNTAGFKADSSLFEEYLMPGAHEDNFDGSDRRVSYVQDRGTYPRFLARRAPNRPTIRSTSRLRRAASWWCRPRAANATPATAACRSTSQGQLVTAHGDRGARQCRTDHISADRSRHQRFARRHHHRGGRQRPHRRAARQASPRQLRRRPEAAEGGLEPLFGRRRRRPRRPTPSRRCNRATSKNPTSTRWRR